MNLEGGVQRPKDKKNVKFKRKKSKSGMTYYVIRLILLKLGVCLEMQEYSSGF